jgi:hypothetical protein
VVATSRRLLLGAAALAVALVVAVGPCRGDDGPTEPLPPPALDGLHLEAEVRSPSEVTVTVRLDASAERAIEVPGLSTEASPPDVSERVLAHRGRLPGGGVLLSVGRGRAEDIEPEMLRSFPPSLPIGPGTTIDLEVGIAPDWIGRDGPADATREELDEAGLVRVCLWGVLHPPRPGPTPRSEDLATRRLGCVDVDR